jgi:hypothetical protein
VIDRHGEIAIGKGYRFQILFAGRAVIRAAHFAVSADPLQKRCDLHIAAEFECAAALGMRRQFQSLCKPRQVFFEIRPRGFGIEWQTPQGAFEVFRHRFENNGTHCANVCGVTF